ncbi:MAG: glycosyltransferase family 4 protein [Planctomycetota bacterium]
MKEANQPSIHPSSFILHPSSLILHPSSFIILHNRYRQSGGEDVVVAVQAQLLKEKGHVVRVFEKDNRGIDRYGLFRKIALFFKTADNTKAALEVARIVEEFKPQIALVHNTLPLLSPAIYAPLKKAGVKVVQFLHNYRLVCPAGTLYRDGRQCELCASDGLGHAVKYRCWNNSLMASLAVARMLQRHRRARTWHTQVDMFVALNTYMRDWLLKVGIAPAEKIIVQPNFSYFNYIAATSVAVTEPGDGFIYAGRLAPEKGIRTLLAAHAELKDVSLKIIGEWPNDRRDGAGSSSDVFTGYQSREQTLREIAAARALVFPSEWQEPFGLSIIEAMALSKPVIASRVAGPKEIVQDGVTGMLFEPGDVKSLADCMRRLHENPELAARLGRAGRDRYLKEYSPEAGYRRLMEICE